MISVKEIKDSFLHLFFPHVCAGCGSDLLNEESMLCIRCMADLPETNFQSHAGNPVEKIFWGRLQLTAATAAYYFTKESLMQQLVHEFKYKGNKELGLQMGRLLGKYLTQSGRFTADALVALPLFPVKERKRGFNQAAVLCDGMAEIMKIPVLRNVIVRPQHTETQTKKGRVERWRNMDGKFVVQDKQVIRNKHLLLVDDVITTGATLEACARELLKGEHTTVGVAALCIASS
jgi:ComF family protein